LILPRSGQREKWRQIQKAMKLKLPRLYHPGWIKLGLFTACVALVMGPCFYVGASYGCSPLSLFLGLIVGSFLIKLSPGLAVAFPNRDITVGDLVRDVLAINHARIVDDLTID
jgi:hypothetical protein